MNVRKTGIILTALIGLGLLIQLNACGASEEDTETSEQATTTETDGETKKSGTNTNTSTTSGSSGSSGSSDGSCLLTDNTTETSTTNEYGCPLLTRDTSSCKASREAQGLSGFWLKFSCNVTLTKDGNNVILSAETLPDYKSFYFNKADACYADLDLSDRAANPNLIAAQTITMTVPYNPTAASSPTATQPGVIGLAVNGVSLYTNGAAPGDDIYEEVATFDHCDGHPDSVSRYHYHTEPSAITNADSEFVGVMRDGFPIYGRNDYATGSTVTGLDSAGGKTSTTVDSPNTPVYHYHINLQTNGTDSAYFISAGYYKGTKGACTGCQ